MKEQAALIEFPTHFPIKVIGKNTSHFSEFVQLTIDTFVNKDDQLDFKESLSRNAEFISITVTINAVSRKQLDDIYLSLSASNLVMMTL